MLSQPDKYEKMIWADFAFFVRWWKEDTVLNTRETMKKFIREGIFQLENGGMVQQDEALSDFKSIIHMFDGGL